MAFRTWREVDAILAVATEPASTKQQQLGKLADVPISRHTPRIVAAAMLRIALNEELALPAARPVSEWLISRLRILHQTSDPPISPQTEEEAEAWVTHLRLIARRESLSNLQVCEGDIVETKDGEVALVSSIGRDGRVYFKGGRGFGSWPDLVSIVSRRDDQSQSARRQAENTASRHSTSSQWSMARHKDLIEFATDRSVCEEDIAELETIIASSKDERPIQKFLEENGHLLTALLGGNYRYCLPQKRLGAEFVPDFIIGDIDSLGIRWVLIELETPMSGIYLKNGRGLDKAARNGVDQILDWRNWLSDNTAYARQRRSENGLGLFDIRESIDALVLVGGRSKKPETKDAKRQEHRQANIEIHSYDWLVDRLRGIIRHQGPPASNPYLIPKAQDY